MKQINFTPFPILQTDRLTLRQITKSDDDIIFDLRTNAEVNKYINRKKCANIEEAHAFIEKISTNIVENRSVMWAICLKDNTAMIGTICLWNINEDKSTGELGYDLLPAFQKHGYMYEAVNAVLDYGFKTLGFSTIEAFTHRENQNSIAMLQKHGFLRDTGRTDDDNENNAIFVLQHSQ